MLLLCKLKKLLLCLELIPDVSIILTNFRSNYLANLPNLTNDFSWGNNYFFRQKDNDYCSLVPVFFALPDLKSSQRLMQ